MEGNISDGLLKVSKKDNLPDWCQKTSMLFILTMSKCQKKLYSQDKVNTETLCDG